MVVLTQNRKSGVIGLHVGAGNVQRYFPRHIQMVEFELDHLCIICSLEPAFWQDAPEIHDVRLSLWLESKRTSGKLSGNSAPIALVPAGLNTFRLHLTVDEPLITQAHPMPFLAQRTDSVPDSATLPPGQIERRARRRPVVRDLGRLNANELPVASAIH